MRLSLMKAAHPGFPVKFMGVDALHAAFLNESRTRGRLLGPRTGNPGTRSVQCSVAGNPGKEQGDAEGVLLIVGSLDIFAPQYSPAPISCTLRWDTTACAAFLKKAA